MSKPTPRNCSAIAEHSMCQPGRPAPQGACQHVSSPGLCAFHSAKSSGSCLRAVSGSDAASSPWSMFSSWRCESAAVAGIRAHAEVHVAVDRSRRARRSISVWMYSTIGPIVSRGERLVVGAPEPERVGVGAVALGHLARPAPRSARPWARGGVVDLVVDVGDVHHQRHVVALVLEEALEQAEDDERPRVADVDAAVHGRPARVDARRARGRVGAAPAARR